MLLNNFTILCVEDNIDTQNHIKLILEDSVKDLFIAYDGVEGLEIYKKKKPDIVIADINMPNMDGLTMLRKIKKIDKNQPIIIISAFDDKENLLEAINIGSNGFIPKPINIEFLSEKLNAISENLQDQIEANNTKNSLYNLAHYDKLTGISNKFLFEIKLDQAISKAKRDKQEIAVFFIDLDNFKTVNDTFGHKAGDYVLKTVANNIKKSIRKEDMIARRSGDEFLLLVEDIPNKSTLINLANKIIESSQIPIHYENNTINISSSIGISIFPSDAQSVDELINQADIFMYKAKNTKKSKIVLNN